ncbi:MAG: LUD domain-containing protein, partial [Longimicrobiales bacterium]|nr:LUD domain-containing protein [Longimicrobiales bacterium]
DFGGWRPGPGPHRDSQRTEAGGASAVDEFEFSFCSAGGEVARISDAREVRPWIEGLAGPGATVAVGEGVGPDYVPKTLSRAAPADADVGLSRATGGVAGTGSLILLSSDGRLTQLLPPLHVIVVDGSSVHRTLREALMAIGGELPSAVGLHSGPSKSADIGQVMVRGVHGPGRVVALVLTRT